MEATLSSNGPCSRRSREGEEGAFGVIGDASSMELLRDNRW